MKVGLVIGRFQPLHNGHVALIQKAMDDNDVVLVLVGSQNKLTDYRNPFDIETRLELLKEHFAQYDKMYFKGMDDYPNNEQWVEDVISRVNTITDDPRATTVYTSDKDAEFYRMNFLYSVEVSPSKGLNATDIREFSYRAGGIHHNIPQVTKEFLTNWLETDEYNRLRKEYYLCVSSKEEAIYNHSYGNPIEPVAHAMVIQGGKVLLVKRSGVRGHGQWALPGGFIQHTETTRAGALRELQEETSLDLLNQPRAAEVAFAIEENMNGLSTRTIGFNYCYAVHPDETLDIVAGDDAQDVQWFSLEDVANGDMPLFYNHTTVVRRLLEEIK